MSDQTLSRWLTVTLIAGLTLQACGTDSASDGPRDADLAGGAVAAVSSAAGDASSRIPQVTARGVSDSAFAALIEGLSEPGGFFDTDNLISNERSYLHVLGALERMGVEGGAFIGVGPDQSFSYISAVRPEMAYIIDIRRDNLLQHLWFKALFEAAPTRIEYLSRMFGRPAPPDPAAWTEATPEALASWVDEQPYDRAYEAQVWEELLDHVEALGVPLTADEMAKIGTIFHQFAQAGLGLRFTSHFRGPRPGYPTYRDLLTETDFQGRQASYLATEAAYVTVRNLQLADRVVPVVGDLAGSHALVAIGEDARSRGLQVSAFYTSNVEFYLVRDGIFGDFADNVASLPMNDRSMIIRSLFNRFETLPQSRPGYTSTQLLQPMEGFVDAWEAGGFAGYWDLVTRHDVPLN